MKGDSADEIFGIIDRITPIVLSSAPNPRGEVATSLRRAIGMMQADRNMVIIQVFVFAFAGCLNLARQAGATLPSMDRVRKAALKEAPKTFDAMQTVLAIIRLTLSAESRIIATMSFRSREEVDQISVAVNAAFSQTIEVAADDLDAGTYQALIALHGDVVQHLASVGRVLPRIIFYSYPMVMPALRMADRAYHDPKRYQELVNENSVVHPAFMPIKGKMLAV